MIGKFHRPKPSPAPNAFESAPRGAGGSLIIATDPSWLYLKRGPAKSPAPPTLPGSYNQVVVYSKAKSASLCQPKAAAAKDAQRGQASTSANCWLAAIAVAAVFAMAQQLDISLAGPSDIEAAQDVAAEAATVAMVLP